MIDIDALSSVQLWLVCLWVASVITVLVALLGLLEDDDK